MNNAGKQLGTVGPWGRWRRHFRPANLRIYAFRALVRFLAGPARRLDEGRTKQLIRYFILSFQNSLPTELAVNRGDTVIQIGTPWPRTLRRFRRAVGDTGRLIIFEAEPRNHARLKEAIEADGMENVELILAAAWSVDATGQLHLSPHAGDHKVQADGITMDNDLRPENDYAEKIEVDFRTIDSVLKDLGVNHVDYISVTVNGAELEVLKGARETLVRSRPIRVFSKGHALTEAGVPLHTEIRVYLEGLGLNTKISRGELSAATQGGWGRRGGDIYGWAGMN